MATLNFNGTTAYVKAHNLSTSLNAIPNGACTIALLLRRASTADNDGFCGLINADVGSESDYYHAASMNAGSTTSYFDDDGLVGITWTGAASHPTGAGGNNFCIVVWDWGTGTATERIHVSAGMGSAESWVHEDSDGNNGGLRAGPGTSTGYFTVGGYNASDKFAGDIALVAVWAGTRFSDADAEALWIDKKTSDWYNHSAGHPDTLIELTSTTLTDIGDDPAPTLAVVSATATGADPTGWTFDGRAAAPPPDAGPRLIVTQANRQVF